MRPDVLWPAVAGAALAAVILWDAFETILVPRRIGRRIRLTRWFYLLAWRAWRRTALATHRASRRESVLGFFGPLSLIVLLGVWATALVFAFALLQLAAHAASGGAPVAFGTLFYMSGETFFTLGFGDVTPASTAGRWLSVLESGTGFGFLGTVVGYLPTMYAAFAQREIEISLLDAHAGTPPTAAECLARRASGAPAAEATLRDWERWSAQLLETHISYPQLAYYRSQHVNQSWLAALTAMLDTTAVLLAREEAPPGSPVLVTFAMARHALVDITQIFVARPPAVAPERLDAAALAALRARLRGTSQALPEDEAFAARLAAIRRKYEPYAQALAAHLLFELPPFVHAAPRRDNWRGGPWDRALAAAAHDPDDHF